MKLGRELDLLVAEHIFGYTVFSKLNGSIVNQHDELDAPNFYSTDISAAWEVVEKMENYFELTKIVIELAKTKTVYTAKILIGNDSFKVHSESAPHAICLAALKAKGVEIGNHE